MQLVYHPCAHLHQPVPMPQQLSVDFVFFILLPPLPCPDCRNSDVVTQCAARMLAYAYVS